MTNYRMTKDKYRMTKGLFVIRHLVFVISYGLAAHGLGGCSSPAPYEFDELDLAPVQNELIEFPLGHYEIPIPVLRTYEQKGASRRNRLEMSFDLYALIPRHLEKAVADKWARHEGKIRDRVIRVCRAASLEELQEVDLTTLKSHLTDAVQAQLGRTMVRRLLIVEVQLREL